MSYHEEMDDLENMEDPMDPELRKAEILEFVNGCYDAYDMIVRDGVNVITEAGETEIKKAISRMTALFTVKEEYEKCRFLVEFAKINLPNFNVEPDLEVMEHVTPYV